MSNNFEQLQLATLRLSQDGSIKDRLIEAYDAHLSAIEAQELPDHLREEFDAVYAFMHREPPQVRESPVRASVRKMSVSEASGHAAVVVKLFAEIARAEAGPPARHSRLPASVVQLFPVEA